MATWAARVRGAPRSPPPSPPGIHQYISGFCWSPHLTRISVFLGAPPLAVRQPNTSPPASHHHKQKYITVGAHNQNPTNTTTRGQYPHTTTQSTQPHWGYKGEEDAPMHITAVGKLGNKQTHGALKGEGVHIISHTYLAPQSKRVTGGRQNRTGRQAGRQTASKTRHTHTGTGSVGGAFFEGSCRLVGWSVGWFRCFAF